MTASDRVTVVGAGLAGCEAAWQLARRGIAVTLVEMKPAKRTPAHSMEGFAELVCSNSLRANALTIACGLRKEEMRRLDSLILRAADENKIPAGGALAVDRDGFSAAITGALRAHPLIEIRMEEALSLPEPPAIVATGPLTSDALAAAIAARFHTLCFYDAAAPIVTLDSIDMRRVFRASRYGKGGDDYLNCPMTKDEYFAFYEALINARTAPVHGFEETSVFEGCMPVESMARRGPMALAFGPLKPVGLVDPATNRRPFANVQLRQDDAAATLYNLVGFQTRLAFGEQRRVFGMIPGLENAEFARYGVMHRNTFLQSPGILSATFEVLETPGLYFAGQITGVEGYVESAASGLVAGLSLARQLHGLPAFPFPTTTALGALGRHVSSPNRAYQPMNITFGLIDDYPETIRNKAARYEAISRRALGVLDQCKGAFEFEWN